jgi:hypothetical protein
VLAKHNIKAEVSFSGRDGKLEGEVESQEIINTAYRLSLKVFGTRIIHNHLIVKGEQDDMAMAEIEIKPHQPIVKKASYLAQPEQSVQKAVYREILPVIEKPQTEHISDVDKIMMAMNQQTLPTRDAQTSSEKISSILLPERKKALEKNAKIEKTEESTTQITTQSSHSIQLKNNAKQQVLLKNNKANDLLKIIDGFNLSLDSLIDENTINKQQTTQSQTIDDIDLSSIRFASHSTILPIEAHSALDKVAASIKAHSLSYIELIAYADDSDIAYARGAIIRDYLVTQNIRKDSVHVAGHTMEDNKNKVTAFKFVTY